MKKFKNVESKLKSLISNMTGVDYKEIKPKSTSDDLDLDSLDSLELLMDIEQEFNIEIADEDAEKFKTFQDVVDFIPLGLVENKLDRR
jgi:acyl carrier protein